MGRSEMLSKINEVFEDVLDELEGPIVESTTADDVEEWDSLNHIQLILGIEKSFGIRFNSTEIQSWKDVSEMMDCIEKHLG